MTPAFGDTAATDCCGSLLMGADTGAVPPAVSAGVEVAGSATRWGSRVSGATRRDAPAALEIRLADSKFQVCRVRSEIQPPATPSA